MESEGTNFEDVLSVGGREEIRQAAKDVKLFSRKLKCKVNLRVYGVHIADFPGKFAPRSSFIKT